MSDSDDTISKFLGLRPRDEIQTLDDPQVEVLPPEKHDNDSNTVDSDFDFSRENLYDSIQKGKIALDSLLELAKQSESPRAYEVLSGLISTLVAANKDLMDLSKKKSDIKEKIGDGQGNPANVTNNNLFVGSTKELQELLEKMKNGQDS